MSEERVPRDEGIQPASDNERSNRRLAFQIVVGVLMVALLFLFVIQPAIARGGFSELVIIAGIFLAVLLTERWLRTR